MPSRTRRSLAAAARCFTLAICKPFETEFEDMLNLYPDDDFERQKDLAESMKSMMSTFSMIGSLILSAVWAVNGPDIEEVADDSIWGSWSGTGHAVYKALTTCASIVCILLVGTTARTSFLMDLIPYGGHKDAIKAWGHVHIVVLPYLMFALIVFLVVSCITLQATLTSRAVAGFSTGCFVVGLCAMFTFSWIRADRVLGVTLTSMITKQSHTGNKRERHVT